MGDQPGKQEQRARLVKLFEFLKAYTDLRYPPVRDINKQPGVLWLADLPSHPSIELFPAGQADAESEESDVVLRLTRPVITPCPAPPAVLSEWLKPGWHECPGRVEVQANCTAAGREGQAGLDRFEEDRQRPALLRTWQQQREHWVITERPARQSLELFQTVYGWYGAQEREGEKIELLIGDGLLPMGGTLLEDAPREDGNKAEFSAQSVRPPFHQRPPLEAATRQGGATIERRPVIFMRQRRTGPASVFDWVLEDIAARDAFPPSLLQILGLAEGAVAQSESGSGGVAFGNEDDDVLMSKPANREQLEIAKQLAGRDCVLVQGPPGTGKTHTIANLLGHLLAQGKRVLVTAHTPKALRVLRQKVVEPLQPLCLSVLHNDKQSQEELQGSVRKIHLRLAEDDRLLERDAQRLREERKRILDTLREARQRLINGLEDESRDVVSGGKATRPVDAAKRVKEGCGKDDWIPEPVSPGESLPLSHAEVVALYQTNARVSLDDERELNGHRPELDRLPAPNEFSGAVAELNATASQDPCLRGEVWDDALEPDDLSEFDRLLELAGKTIEFLRVCAPWQLEAVQAGRDGEPARQVWESFSELIEKTWREVKECYALVVEHGPSIDDARSPRELLPLVEQILRHIEARNSFGLLTKLSKRHWFDLLEKIRVGGRPPDLKTPTQFRAGRALLRMRLLREQLVERWDRLMACQGAPPCSALGEKPEEVCRPFVTQIRACLEWHASTWQPLEGQFERLGFRWSAFLESTPPETGANAELGRIRRAVLGELGAILQSRRHWLRHQRLKAMLAAW